MAPPNTQRQLQLKAQARRRRAEAEGSSNDNGAPQLDMSQVPEEWRVESQPETRVQPRLLGRADPESIREYQEAGGRSGELLRQATEGLRSGNLIDAATAGAAGGVRAAYDFYADPNKTADDKIAGTMATVGEFSGINPTIRAIDARSGGQLANRGLDKIGLDPSQYTPGQDESIAAFASMFSGGRGQIGSGKLAGRAPGLPLTPIKDAALDAVSNLTGGASDVAIMAGKPIVEGVAKGTGALRNSLRSSAPVTAVPPTRPAQPPPVAPAQPLPVINATPAAPVLSKGQRRVARDTSLILSRIMRSSRVKDADIKGYLPGAIQRFKAVNDERIPFAFFLEGDLPQHFPQAIADEVKTKLRAWGRERNAATGPQDTSRKTTQQTIQELRGSQKEYLQTAATRNLGKGKLIQDEDRIVKSLRETGRKGYEPVLQHARDAMEGKRAPTAEEVAGFEELRQVLQRPVFKDRIPNDVKMTAEAEGFDLMELVERDPVTAAHWLQSNLRKLEDAAEDIGGKATPASLAYSRMREAVLDPLKKAAPGYEGAMNRYGHEIGAKQAVQFGRGAFTISRSAYDTGKKVRQFKAMTARQKTVALKSIRDEYLNEFRGTPEEKAAKITRMRQEGSLDFLERLGPRGKRMATAIRKIADENEAIRAIDQGSGSPTHSNIKGAEDAQKMVQSPVNKAIGSLGDQNSWPVTMAADAILMATTPVKWPVASTAKIGGQLVKRLGNPSPKVLSRATEGLYRLPPPKQVGNKLASPPKAKRVAGPPKKPKSSPPQDIGSLLKQLDEAERDAKKRGGPEGQRILNEIAAERKQIAGPPKPPVSRGQVDRMGFGSSPKLDMSEGARLQRARKMGLKRKGYHATVGQFDEFDPTMGEGVGVHIATDATQAGDIRRDLQRMYPSERARVLELRFSAKKPLRLPDLKHWSTNRIAAELNKRGIHVARSHRQFDGSLVPTLEDLKAALDARGYDSIIYRNKFEGGRNRDSYLILDQSKIRRTDAAFDPSQQGSSKILAGVGGPEGAGATIGAGIGYATAPDTNRDGTVDLTERAMGGIGGAATGIIGGKLVRAAPQLKNALRSPPKSPRPPPGEARAPDRMGPQVSERMFKGRDGTEYAVEFDPTENGAVVTFRANDGPKATRSPWKDEYAPQGNSSLAETNEVFSGVERAIAEDIASSGRESYLFVGRTPRQHDLYVQMASRRDPPPGYEWEIGDDFLALNRIEGGNPEQAGFGAAAKSSSLEDGPVTVESAEHLRQLQREAKNDIGRPTSLRLTYDPATGNLYASNGHSFTHSQSAQMLGISGDLRAEMMPGDRFGKLKWHNAGNEEIAAPKPFDTDAMSKVVFYRGSAEDVPGVAENGRLGTGKYFAEDPEIGAEWGGQTGKVDAYRIKGRLFDLDADTARGLENYEKQRNTPAAEGLFARLKAEGYVGVRDPWSGHINVFDERAIVRHPAGDKELGRTWTNDDIHQAGFGLGKRTAKSSGEQGGIATGTAREPGKKFALPTGFQSGYSGFGGKGPRRELHPRDVILAYNENVPSVENAVALGLDESSEQAARLFDALAAHTRRDVRQAKAAGKIDALSKEWGVTIDELEKFMALRSTAGKAEARLSAAASIIERANRSGETLTIHEVVDRLAAQGITATANSLKVMMSMARSGKGEIRISDALRERIRNLKMAKPRSSRTTVSQQGFLGSGPPKPPPAQMGLVPPKGNALAKGLPRKRPVMAPKVIDELNRAAKSLPPAVRTKIAENALLPPALRKSVAEATGDAPEIYGMAAPFQKTPGIRRIGPDDDPRSAIPTPNPIERGVREGLERVGRARPPGYVDPAAQAADLAEKNRRRAVSEASRTHNRNNPYSREAQGLPDVPLPKSLADREKQATDLAVAARNVLRSSNLEAISTQEAQAYLAQRVQEITDALLGRSKTAPLPPETSAGVRPGATGAPQPPKQFPPASYEEAQQMADLIFNKENAQLLDDVLSGRVIPRDRDRYHMALGVAAALAGGAASFGVIYANAKGASERKAAANKPPVEEPADPRYYDNPMRNSLDYRRVRESQTMLSEIFRQQLKVDGIMIRKDGIESKTQKIVKRFQWEHQDDYGLEVTGLLDDATIDAMGEEYRKALRARNSSGSAARPPRGPPALAQ